MKRMDWRLGAMTVMVCAGLVGAVYALGSNVSHDGGVQEKWINANLMRVNLGDGWQDVPLVPLAEHQCEGNNPLFRKHCN